MNPHENPGANKVSRRVFIKRSTATTLATAMAMSLLQAEAAASQIRLEYNCTGGACIVTTYGAQENPGCVGVGINTACEVWSDELRCSTFIPTGGIRFNVDPVTGIAEGYCVKL
jgi:hypothetical protein